MTGVLRIAGGMVATMAGAAVLVACPGPPPEADPPVVEAPPPGWPAPQAYHAQLEPLAGSGVSGTVTVAVDQDRLRARVEASGLEPGQPVPQHVHLGSTCQEPGGIMLNLDRQLGLAGETPPDGDMYPTADDQGNVVYDVTRSLPELRSAALEVGVPGPEEFDLANRVVNLHGQDMQPLACGQLELTG